MSNVLDIVKSKLFCPVWHIKAVSEGKTQTGARVLGYVMYIRTYMYTHVFRHLVTTHEYVVCSDWPKHVYRRRHGLYAPNKSP